MEVSSNIANIREIEDCIRATKKYTKGAFRRKQEHPIQGEEFPSKVITEYYEVYPYCDISPNMPVGQAWAWVWGDEIHIDIYFKYNYSCNRASIEIYNALQSFKSFNGNRAVDELKKMIPGFAEALEKAGE